MQLKSWVTDSNSSNLNSTLLHSRLDSFVHYCAKPTSSNDMILDVLSRIKCIYLFVVIAPKNTGKSRHTDDITISDSND